MGKKEFAFTIYSKKAKRHINKYWFRNRAANKSLNIKPRHKWVKMSETDLAANLSFSYSIKIPFTAHPFSY